MAHDGAWTRGAQTTPFAAVILSGAVWFTCELPREVETPAPALNMTGLMNTLKPRGQQKGRRERRPRINAGSTYCRLVVFFLPLPKLVSTDAPMLDSICLAASA